MSDKLISRLEKEGRLRRQNAGYVQVEALLRQAIMDLEEARKVRDLAERATYVMVYMAMLKAGRALLLWKGYVPDDGAQHRTVVEVTGLVLGKKFQDIVNHFERMRRKRNEMTYEAGTLVTKSEARKAFSDAILLIDQILKAVRRTNPQMELKLDMSEVQKENPQKIL